MSKIEINNLTSDKKVYRNFLKKVADKTFKIIKLKKFDEFSIVLVGDSRMRDLNKKYRKTDRVTDVLAFDYGEIFICLPQAKRQAKKLGHSFRKELTILIIHGILHLAGYSDRTKKDYNKMIKKQRNIWQKII